MHKNLDIFENYVTNKHKTKIIGEISLNNLVEQIIEVPSIQRILDINKVTEIYNYQDKFYKENNCFNFIGTINIQCLNDNNFLIDGQHRYNAIKKLYENNYKKQTVFVELNIISSKTQLIDNYKLINKNTQLPEFPEEIDEDIPKQVCQFIQILYPNIWKSSRRPTRPFLNFNQFQEAVGYLILKLNENSKQNVTVGYIKKLILDKNNKMSYWDLSKFQQIKTLKNSTKIIEKCKTNKFYLGMYPHKNYDYGYEWIKDLIISETGCELKTIKKLKIKRKKKIPPVIREQVWDKYIGKTITNLCLCCGIKEIKNTKFHCGHIISEHDGGKITLENLRPICYSCNTSMGTENAIDYIKRNFPKNLSKFKYGIQKKNIFNIF